jgi:Rnl2 family RNA ligase
MFSHYNKIPNVRKADGEPEVVYTVSEKVHGCNFSIIVPFGSYCDDAYPASRNQRLEGDAPFFYKGWKEVFYKYAPLCIEIGREAKAKNPELTQITVYGELFGNGVQKEILYREQKEFYAFDIAHFVGDEKTFVPTADFEALMTRFNFAFWARPLLKCSFEEAFAFPVETFRSTVATNPDCDIEGVIIRNNSEKFKLKTARFQERGKKGNPVTKSRLRSVQSKIGPAQPVDEVVSAMVADIKEDEIDGAYEEMVKELVVLTMREDLV